MRLLLTCLCCGLSALMCAHPAAAQLPGVDVPILMYHHFGDAVYSQYWVTDSDFEAQMAYLQSNGYTTITPDQLLAYRLGTAPLPAKPIILTIDDGYESAYTRAKPILDKHGFTATLSIVTDFVGATEAERQQGTLDPDDATAPDPYLIWPEIVAMVGAGETVASHTCSHQDLTLLPADQLANELTVSKATLESQLGIPIHFLAYPYGKVNSTVRAAVEAAGYEGALVDTGGVENTATAAPYGLRRIFVCGGESLGKFAASLVPPSPPVPQITSVVLSQDSVTLGQTVDISVTAVNTGGDAGRAGLSISFPSLTGSDAAALVDPLAADWGSYDAYPAGASIYDQNDHPMLAQYLLVECKSPSWAAQTSRTFTLRIRPPAFGTFDIYVRAWMRDTRLGLSHPDPASSPVSDQQGWPVAQYSVAVNPDKSAPPVADFTATPTVGMLPLEVSFTDTSTGSLTSWSWGFGDGETSDLQNPVHTYAAAGIYSVTLTVSGGEGSSEKTEPHSILVTFLDVPFEPEYWAMRPILGCVDAGVVVGYSNGTYRPADPVTRDQMAVYIGRALAGGDARVPTGPAEGSFPDVPPTQWAYRYIEYAKAQGVVTGYPDGTYAPASPVDRGQMAVYISRAIASPTGEAGLASYVPPIIPSFPDVAADFWAYKYIERAKSAGVVQGYPDGTYQPDVVVTRDQMAVYVARAFNLMP